MNRLAFGAALLALAAVVSPLRAEDPAPAQATKAPWYKRMFGIGPDPLPPPKPVKHDPAMDAARERARAEADLTRRQQVCDELRLIALDTKNESLAAKADELDRQAWELYRKQTEQLPCSRLMPAQDEKALDRKLGMSSADAADKLTTPAITVPSRATASAMREVKP
jgi:hypothetical protein